MVLNGTDGIFIAGDSLTAGFGGSVPVWYVYGPLIRAAYGQVNMPSLASPFVSPARKSWPIVQAVDAVAGRGVYSIAATGGAPGGAPSAAQFAAFLAPYRPASAVIVDLSINDADQIRQGGLSRANFQTEIAIVADGFHNIWGVPYSKILWIMAWGHDSGDDLVQMGQCETDIQALAAARGFTAVKTSQTWDPTLTVGDGTHPIQSGAVARAVPVMAALQFAA